ncbi:cytochrome P450 [Nonomuraea sp. NPDC026600]|uniref:cytochrome P450 n=1 Tax=Nonomuraea sp. NPDC026600 TaxID=3155363 RepID=UPI0033C303D7
MTEQQELPPVLDGFDLSDQSRFGDGFPHHVFTRLRKEAPVFFHPPGTTADGEGFWVLSRYADIRAAAADPAFSSQGGGGRAGGGTHIDDLAPGVHAGTMLNMMDDPRHQALRDLVSPSVDGGTVASLEPELRAIAENLVAEAVADGKGDLMVDIAGPFAIRAALLALGVPRRDWPALHAWADVSMGFDDREVGEDTERSQMSRLALYQYGSGALKALAAVPGPGLLSLAATGELPEGERPLSSYEREVFFNLILGAGSEPPRNAIAHGLLALAEHPDQWKALREDRSLITGAIEEMLRWASPTPYNRRTATRDVEVGGLQIKAGQKVTFWWASANRDEEVFADPHIFDIRREHNPHLAFGFGTHGCMGERLGRLELRLVLEALLDRVGELSTAGPVRWARSNKHTVILRLPVAYGDLTSVDPPELQEEPPPTIPANPGLYAISRLLPFNPFDPEFRADPYPIYRRIAENGPVMRTPGGMVVVMGHREASDALRDPLIGWGDGQSVAEHFGRDHEGRPVRQFIFMDPPDHTRLRSLVSGAFTARVVERLRPRAVELTDQLLASAGSSFDLMDAIAHPLPALLLGDLMGVPEENMDRFRGWSAAIGRGLDPDFALTRAQVAQRQGAREQFNQYFTELAAQRRAQPADDLMSKLVAVEQEGDRLTETELVTTCTLLVSAGYALTVHLIGNGMLALLREPEQRAWLRANPDQIGAAVEELIRYDAPAQVISRTALSDTVIGDTPIQQGEQMLLVLGAANRDPAAYDAPDRLDLARRASARNLGFGHGIHFCLGAPLARLAVQVVIGRLAELDLTIADPGPRHTEGMVVRGLASLPVVAG